MTVSALILAAAAASGYSLDCRVMHVVGPVELIDKLTISTERVGDETFVSVTSESGRLAAERQPLVRTIFEDGSDAPAWLIETADGPRYFEITSHGSRNGSGSGLLISSYRMTTIGSLPEDFFQFHAAGLCSQQSRNAQ